MVTFYLKPRLPLQCIQNGGLFVFKKNMKLFCTWDKIWKYYLNNNNHLIYLLKYWYLLIFPWSYLGFYSLIPCFSNIRIFEKYSVSVNFWSFLWFLVDFFFFWKNRELQNFIFQLYVNQMNCLRWRVLGFT